MAEHRFCKPTVVGSTPTLGSTTIASSTRRARRARSGGMTSIGRALSVAILVVPSLLVACAAFEQPLDIEVRNESAREVVVRIRGEGGAAGAYAVAAGESRVVGGDQPDGWSVWIGDREATSYSEWPADNPSIGLSIYIRADGSVEVVDD